MINETDSNQVELNQTDLNQTEQGNPPQPDANRRSIIGFIGMCIILLIPLAFLIYFLVVSHETTTPCIIVNLKQNLTQQTCWYAFSASNYICDSPGPCYLFDQIALANCTTLSVSVKWNTCQKDYSYMYIDPGHNDYWYNYYSGNLQCRVALDSYGSFNCNIDPFSNPGNGFFIFILLLLVVFVLFSFIYVSKQLKPLICK